MRTLMIALTLFGALPSNQPQDVSWLKLDQAKALSSHTGKMILVYIACDPTKNGMAPCSGGIPERSFGEPSIMKRLDDFHVVRVCEKKTAMVVKATKTHETIFLDPDGDEVYRSSITDGGSLEAVMAGALAKYAPREVTWSREIQPGLGGRPLVVVGFDDEKGESLKIFEDKTIVKYHERIEFVKFPFKKDTEAVKKWAVTQAPAVFICDGAKENPEKNVLEKWTGKKTAPVIKAALQKAFARLEPPKPEVKTESKK